MRGRQALQFARVLLTAAAVGVVVAQEVRKSVRTRTQPRPNDRIERTAAFGRELLSRPVGPDQTLSQYLQRQYAALYLLGRVGAQLSEKEVDTHAKHLQHFHHLLGRQEDGQLVSWYETVGVGQPIPIQKLLLVCPEVVNLEINSDYIAYALRQNVTLEFKGHEEAVDALISQQRLS